VENRGGGRGPASPVGDVESLPVCVLCGSEDMEERYCNPYSTAEIKYVQQFTTEPVMEEVTLAKRKQCGPCFLS
jgi:hypothetical protein